MKNLYRRVLDLVEMWQLPAKEFRFLRIFEIYLSQNVVSLLLCAQGAKKDHFPFSWMRDK